MFAIYGALHPKSDVDIYITRKEGGRGLISIEDCVELGIRLCSWKWVKIDLGC